MKTRLPTLDEEKQGQHLTLPPPYFTVGTIHFGLIVSSIPLPCRRAQMD